MIERNFPIFETEQNCYDLIIEAIETDNPNISKELLLKYKEHFETLGLMLYSPPPKSLLPTWKGYR